MLFRGGFAALVLSVPFVAGCGVLPQDQVAMTDEAVLYRAAVLTTDVAPDGIAVAQLPDGSMMNVSFGKSDARIANMTVGEPVDIEVRRDPARAGHGIVTRYFGPTTTSLEAVRQALAPAHGGGPQAAGANADPIDGTGNRSGVQSVGTTMVRSSAGSTNMFYVNAASGSDTSDGTSADTPFKTINRALTEIPLQVSDRYVVNIASGTYAESLSFRRFVMPSKVNNQQVKENRVPAAITLVGADMDSTTIAAPGGTSCIDATSVVLFLQDFTCETDDAGGIVTSGGSTIFDNIAINALSKAGNGLYAEDSWMAFGGDFRVTGPFFYGMSIRTNSFARTGTTLHPSLANLYFSGMQSTAIFMRDGGNFTNAFEKGSLTVEDMPRAFYGLLDTKMFLSTGIIVNFHNLNSLVEVTQNSFFNSHVTNVTGKLPQPFIRCHKASYILLETVTAPTGYREGDTDGTCTALRF